MVYMLLGTGFDETEAVAPIDLLSAARACPSPPWALVKGHRRSHGIP